jgi:hypothetical protein
MFVCSYVDVCDGWSLREDGWAWDLVGSRGALEERTTVLQGVSLCEDMEREVGLTGKGVFALDGKRSDLLSSVYMESRKAVAVNMLASDASAWASDEKAGAP